MKRFFIVIIFLALAWQSYAGGAIVEELETGFKLLTKQSTQDAKLLGLAAKDSSSFEKLGLAAKDSSSFEKLEIQKAEVDKIWKRLQADAAKLKASDPNYHAPWEPAAKRADWQVRDVLLKAQKPLTVPQIAFKLDVTPITVEKMLAKDQTNQRKVFFKMTGLDAGKYWVTCSKLP